MSESNDQSPTSGGSGKADDEAAFEAVMGLIGRDEYLDHFLGTPEPPPNGPFRTVYRRGTDKYEAARRKGLLDPLPTLVKATQEAVAAAEAAMGLQLPPLLRRLYLEAGNGGFGPGYGILGISPDGHRDDLDRTADQSLSRWEDLPPGLLPICDWGCAVTSFIDCSGPQGMMWGWDPSSAAPQEVAIYAEGLTLADWLIRWVDGTLRQPAPLREIRPE